MTATAAVHLTIQTRLVAAGFALLGTAAIWKLVRRRTLSERFSLIWVVAGGLMLIGAIVPDALDWIATLLGVRDSNVALFSIVLLFLLALDLSLSVAISTQSGTIRRLAQERAIEVSRVESLKGHPGPPRGL